jgi:hypothetical protein
MWLKTKATVTPNGEMAIRRRNASGEVTTERYRLTKDGVEQWEE